MVGERGRSHRQRSRVNYAEPSLKAKRRKPRVDDPTGLTSRKSDSDGLEAGYSGDGTGLAKEHVKRKKIVKQLTELAAAAASPSESEQVAPSAEASTTTRESGPVSYVSPESNSESPGDEDE